ncbi:AAA family ATPase [Desulfobotulus mexicanus]|uniref:ATP-binding protein n=1 Tax=Desulfobotulus mexicanus TaxID=2586642 RepID=UPI001C558544|nr:AAA family ATPase [Desulfobotulus mexicanus]
MKKLPIGIQSFEKIRKNPDEFYYVDKTPFVEKLLNEGGGFFFLSRPRRFGKSLFLDTLHQAFAGRKDLFKGLYLEHNWDWENASPVIHISFGSGVIRSLGELQVKIESFLLDIRNEHGIDYEKKSVDGRFMEAIVKIARKTGKKVVVLIDEYDKPILDRIDDTELAVSIREELKNFYSVLKDADAHLEFVLIAGVSKFSKVSHFSGLNHLQDITLNEAYATLCGYTEGELYSVFEDRLQGLDMDLIRQWYNGYAWLGEKVYNPFAILNALQSRQIRNYWFETGTPTFLIQILKKNNFRSFEMEQVQATGTILDSFDIERISPEALLFQTGYLTIRGMRQIGALTQYTLGYPNMEVKSALNDSLLAYFIDDLHQRESARMPLYESILKGEPDILHRYFHALLAAIPHDWYRKNTMEACEGHYASVFL